jgi:hypothetical protein
MISDQDYKIQEGFETLFLYPGGKKTPVVGQAALTINNGKILVFNIEDKIPKLPLKKTGEIWTTGWDIPTKYAIDADNQCWMDDAHGHPLEPTSKENLISQPELEEEQNKIRKVLDLEILMPQWAQTAISQGFTPPSGWT